MNPEEIFEELDRLSAATRKVQAQRDAYHKVLDSKRTSRLEKAHAASRLIALERTAKELRQQWIKTRAVLFTDAREPGPTNGRGEPIGRNVYRTQENPQR